MRLKVLRALWIGGGVGKQATYGHTFRQTFEEQQRVSLFYKDLFAFFPPLTACLAVIRKIVII